MSTFRLCMTFSNLHRLVFVCLGFGISFLYAGLRLPAPSERRAETDDSLRSISFNRQIRPILSRCIACHGPDDESRQANLRLDTRDGAIADLGGYSAITPGDPASSELMLRIRETDPDLVMPPSSHGAPLSANQINLIAQWIEEGAAYEQHWSYVPPVRVKGPQLSDADWCRNEIDRFVLGRMREEGLQPNGMADPSTLLRRASIDLTGLPPDIESVREFGANPAPKAWEHHVDRMLNDPAFGERFASVWLDLARYADSQGYSSDNLRTIWPYRDYVIRALNENKPFDLFTIEQIAGDLLENPSQDALIATAFHRNTLTNTEGGTSDEEFRNAAVVDRVNTTFAVWMGTTMACAQCHTHKYDPLTQAEYFQFFDIFNQTADNDQSDEAPLMEVMDESVRLRKIVLEERIRSLEEEWNGSIQSTGEVVGRLRKSIADGSIDIPPVKLIRIQLPGSKRILSIAEIEVFVDGRNVASEGVATQSTESHAGPARLAVDGNTDGDFHSGKSVTHTATEDSPWWQLEFDQPVAIDSIRLWNRTDNGLHRRLDGMVLNLINDEGKVVWSQRFEEALKSGRNVPVCLVPEEIASLLAQNDADLTGEQRESLVSFATSSISAIDERKRLLGELQIELGKLPVMATVPVMKQVDASSRRRTRIQIRGSFLNTGDEVTAGMPAVFHPLPAGVEIDRLAAARWLVSRDNPLTARVMVNRLWEQMFGVGLVATSEEFGSQGEFPSHPELLDWLAVELMESGWNLKHVLRLIACSATYQQGSHCPPEKMEIDPYNIWLARGPRVRLSAEMVRDQALAVSGLLSRKMYGPPVHPPKPSLGLKSAFTNSTTDWATSEGEDRYRRAIYTEVRRSAPYPSMSTFDCPNREVAEIRRIATNTPLQALVTLNDPVFFEASQALARRMVDESDSSDPAIVAAKGIELCLHREASAREIDSIVRLHADLLAGFQKDEAAAESFATEPLGEYHGKLAKAEIAAWTGVANALLNLDEMFMKR